jgi:hypothetical protein
MERVLCAVSSISGSHLKCQVFAQTPVLPEVDRVGALSAQLKRPRSRCATGALRRLQSNAARDKSQISSLNAREDLDRTQQVFHLCSHGSRDAKPGAKPWLEGAHALRQRLSAGNQVYEALRLSKAA